MSQLECNDEVSGVVPAIELDSLDSLLAGFDSEPLLPDVDLFSEPLSLPSWTSTVASEDQPSTHTPSDVTPSAESMTIGSAANSESTVSKVEPVTKIPISRLPADKTSKATAPPRQVALQPMPFIPRLPVSDIATCPTVGHKRLLSDDSSSDHSSEQGDTKRSKREIRQMKNRESANRSRQRRKARLDDLQAQVTDLTRTQHEQNSTIAALRAENKALREQNEFLRSFVSSAVEPSAIPKMQSWSPSAIDTRDGELDLQGIDPKSKEDTVVEQALWQSSSIQEAGTRSPISSFSLASFAVGASLFSLAIVADVDNGIDGVYHVRGSGRVLHSLSDEMADTSPAFPMRSYLWSNVCAVGSYLLTSETAAAVFLNVVTLVVVLSMYHLWQKHFVDLPVSLLPTRKPHAKSDQAKLLRKHRRASVATQHLTAIEPLARAGDMPDTFAFGKVRVFA